MNPHCVSPPSCGSYPPAVLEEERVFDRIDVMIGKREPLPRVLRLLCLQCQAENGFKQAQFDFYRRELVQTYGFETLFSLYNLERLGLLYQRQSVSWSGGNWGAVRRSLRLVVEDFGGSEPTDIAYVTAGCVKKKQNTRHIPVQPLHCLVYFPSLHRLSRLSLLFIRALQTCWWLVPAVGV